MVAVGHTVEWAGVTQQNLKVGTDELLLAPETWIVDNGAVQHGVLYSNRNKVDAILLLLS